jgi:hypothetical protein
MEAIALMFATEMAIAFPEVGEMRSCCGLFGGRSYLLMLEQAIACSVLKAVKGDRLSFT